MKLALASCLTTLSFAAGPAAAQAPPPPPPPQLTLPGIPATSVGGTLDARLDYTYIEDSDTTLISTDAHFQYVMPTGLGGYISLPFTYAHADTGGFGDDTAAGIGNIELGGLYVARNSQDLDLFVRGGFSLDSSDDEVALIGPATRVIAMPEDSLASGFATSWARLGGGLRTRGPMQFGAQAGLDVPLDSDDVFDFDGVLSVTGAIGFVQPGFGLSGGLTYLRILGTDSDDADTFGFNGMLDVPAGPNTTVFGAFGLNLDEFDDQLGFSIGGGVRARL